jgi:hypothetical protein
MLKQFFRASLAVVAVSALSFPTLGFARPSSHSSAHLSAYRLQTALPGLANKWVLVVRHAEKPADGTGLTPAGEARAKAYVNYFTHYKTATGVNLKLSVLIATKDTKKSFRERLTLEPLSAATGLPLNLKYKEKDFNTMVSDLGATPQSGNVLICWHHGGIPELVTALGSNGEAMFPGGKWPADHFDYVIELHYDAQGKVIPADTHKIVEPTF